MVARAFPGSAKDGEHRPASLSVLEPALLWVSPCPEILSLATFSLDWYHSESWSLQVALPGSYWDGSRAGRQGQESKTGTSVRDELRAATAMGFTWRGWVAPRQLRGMVATVSSQ